MKKSLSGYTRLSKTNAFTESVKEVTSTCIIRRSALKWELGKQGFQF